MIFANRISSSTSCSIWLPETSPPSSSRDVLRHRFQSCNTSPQQAWSRDCRNRRPTQKVAKCGIAPEFITPVRAMAHASNSSATKRAVPTELPRFCARGLGFERGTRRRSRRIGPENRPHSPSSTKCPLALRGEHGAKGEFIFLGEGTTDQVSRPTQIGTFLKTWYRHEATTEEQYD